MLSSETALPRGNDSLVSLSLPTNTRAVANKTTGHEDNCQGVQHLVLASKLGPKFVHLKRRILGVNDLESMEMPFTLSSVSSCFPLNRALVVEQIMSISGILLLL